MRSLSRLVLPAGKSFNSICIPAWLLSMKPACHNQGLSGVPPLKFQAASRTRTAQTSTEACGQQLACAEPSIGSCECSLRIRKPVDLCLWKMHCPATMMSSHLPCRASGRSLHSPASLRCALATWSRLGRQPWRHVQQEFAESTKWRTCG